MLDLNGLRMGKILEVIDMLTLDSCHQYLGGDNAPENVFFQSIAMGGLTF